MLWDYIWYLKINIFSMFLEGCDAFKLVIWKVWICQRVNQKPQVKEQQPIQGEK